MRDKKIKICQNLCKIVTKLPLDSLDSSIYALESNQKILNIRHFLCKF